MADLLDIAPSTAVEVIKIDGKRVVVRGLRCDAVASIVSRFPKIIGLLLGGGGADMGPMLIAQFGNAVGPIIAAGVGHLNDEKYERHASTVFVLEDQLKLVKAIIGLTFPNGIGFFVEAMANLTGGAGEEAKVHKVRLRQSRSSSQPSSDGASRPIMQ